MGKILFSISKSKWFHSVDLSHPCNQSKAHSLEVKKLRGLMNVAPDAVKLHLDSWGVKKLFSYMIRKAGKDKGECTSDPKRREPLLMFYLSLVLVETYCLDVVLVN